MAEVPDKVATASRSVVRVGDGRGFVVRGWPGRLVVTAAHCLPHLPPCHGMSYIEERTYGCLLGPLGEKPTVAAECLFADPVADLAVLGAPDSQELWSDAEQFEALTRRCRALRVQQATADGAVWVLQLGGNWVRCRAKHIGGPLWLEEAADVI